MVQLARISILSRYKVSVSPNLNQGLYTIIYHKLIFIIEDWEHFAILRKQLLKSGEKQCICIFAVLNLAHKHVQLNEFCSDFNSETSSELLPLRSTIINLLFFFSKKIFFFYIDWSRVYIYVHSTEKERTVL